MFSVLLAELWPYIAAAAGIIAGLFFVRQSGKAAGRAEIERKQTESAAEQRGKINEVDTKLSKMGDGDIRDELRKWVRPNDS